MKTRCGNQVRGEDVARQHDKLWRALGVRPADSALDGMIEARLSDRQATVLRRRFGLEDGRPLTLKQTGLHIGRSAERARQIEAEALVALRLELVAYLPKYE